MGLKLLENIMINSTKDDSFQSIGFLKARSVTIEPEVLKEQRIIMGLPNCQHSDLFRVLRTNVLKQLRENGWNNFIVTSATQGAGKTVVSLNLAIAIALEGNQSVLLVDADLRRPSVSQHLGFECEMGFVDYLTGATTLDQVLVNPGIERLVVLPGRNTKSNYSELISSPKMADFIKEVKSQDKSRIVIFDIPPLFVADDALLFMSYFDATLFVVEDEKNTVTELMDSMQLLEQTNLLGVVLNKSRQPIPSYKYGYNYI